MLFQLMRGTARGNKMNLIEVKLPVRCSGHGKMPVVYRVKRSAKQRDTSWMMFCCRALRLRGRQYASQGDTTIFRRNSIFSHFHSTRRLSFSGSRQLGAAPCAFQGAGLDFTSPKPYLNQVLLDRRRPIIQLTPGIFVHDRFDVMPWNLIQRIGD